MTLRCVTATLSWVVDIRPGESHEDALARSLREKYGNNQPKIMSFTFSDACAPTCEGCQYDEPGQRAHMQPNGCLYVPSLTSAPSTQESSSSL